MKGDRCGTWWASSEVQQLQAGFVDMFAYVGLSFSTPMASCDFCRHSLAQSAPEGNNTQSHQHQKRGSADLLNNILNATSVVQQIFSYLCGASHTAVLFFGLTESWSRNLWRTSSGTLGVMEIGADKQDSVSSSSRAAMPGQLTRSRHDQTILPPECHNLRAPG
jgi:hypothetical protein